MPDYKLVLAIVPTLMFPAPLIAGDDPAPDQPTTQAADEPASPEEQALIESWERYQALLASGDNDAALDELALLVDNAKIVLPEGDERIPALQLNYATLLLQLEHEFDAEIAFDDARELYVATYGEGSVGMVPFIMAEGDRIAGYGKGREQKRKYKEALRIVADEHGKQSLEYAEVCYDAGRRILELSGSVVGQSMLEDSVEIFEETLGPADMRTAQAQIALARLYHAKGKASSADKLLEKALAAADLSSAEGRDWAIETRQYLAQAYVRINKMSKATPHLQELAFLIANGSDADPVIVARIAADYPEHLLQDGVDGSVSFSVEVDEEGFVETIEVLGHAGSEEFVRPARKAIKKYRFTPAVRDGELVAHNNFEVRVQFDSALEPRGTEGQPYDPNYDPRLQIEPYHDPRATNNGRDREN